MNEQPIFTRYPLECSIEMQTKDIRSTEGRHPIPLRMKTKVKIGRIVADLPQYRPGTLVE